MIPMDEIERVARVKASLVHDVGERADLCPIVVHHRGGIHVATVHACGPRERDDLRLPLVSTRIATAAFGTDELVLTAEAHTLGDADTHTAETTAPGELARAYAADPESAVTESLVSTYVRRGSDESTMLVMPYRYTDDGGVLGVEFDEVRGPFVATSGAEPEAMVAAVNLPDDDPAFVFWRCAEVPQGLDERAQLLVAMFDHGVMLVNQ